MTNSKNKGNSFERKIANKFSKRFSSVLGLEKAFSRNSDSGSFFGGVNEQRLSTHGTEHAKFGDIVCPKNFNFVIECKHYKNPPQLISFLNQDILEWDKWIEQAKRDSKNAEKHFLLIIKYNRVDEIVLTSLEINNTIKYKNYCLLTLEEFLRLPNNIFFED